MPLQSDDSTLRNRAEAIVQRLNSEYPEAKLSLGYIGNYEGRHDYTRWYAFSKLSLPKSYGHKSYMWGGYDGADGGAEKLYQWVLTHLEREVEKAVASNDGPYKGPEPYPRWASLRSQIIRLAHSRPDLRPHLIPLMK